jgi:hypothetical protein
VNDQVYQRLIAPWSRAHGVDATFNARSNQLVIDHEESPGGDRGVGSTDGQVLVEDIDYILGVIQERAAVDSKQSSDMAVELNVEEEIPDVFVTEESLECLRSYLDDRPEVGRYSVAGTNDYIELEAADGQTIDRCVDQLRDEFEGWATARY